MAACSRAHACLLSLTRPVTRHTPRHTMTCHAPQDDDLAVDFVTAASNLRAACYGIPQQSAFAAKVWRANTARARVCVCVCVCVCVLGGGAKGPLSRSCNVALCAQQRQTRPRQHTHTHTHTRALQCTHEHVHVLPAKDAARHAARDALRAVARQIHCTRVTARGTKWWNLRASYNTTPDTGLSPPPHAHHPHPPTPLRHRAAQPHSRS
jgi:hypothetical protein